MYSSCEYVGLFHSSVIFSPCLQLWTFNAYCTLCKGQEIKKNMYFYQWEDISCISWQCSCDKEDISIQNTGNHQLYFVLSYTIILGDANLIVNKKLSHSLVRRISIFINSISIIFMILRMFFAMWLSLSCTLNKFLTYSEKSSSYRIIWNARKRFSLFNSVANGFKQIIEMIRSFQIVLFYYGLWVYKA